MYRGAGQGELEHYTCVLCRKGGFAIRRNEPDQESESSELIHVRSRDIPELIRRGRVDTRTWITEAEIADKGKANIFLKIFTLLQILWLCVLCVARLAQVLALTTLEVAALAYIPCATVLYFTWWYRPYEVDVPTVLHLGNARTFHNDTVGAANDPGFPADDDLISKYYSTASACFRLIMREPDPSGSVSLPTVAFLTVFGAIHMAAWNLEFPTTTELNIWRTSSLLITVTGPAIVLIDPYGGDKIPTAPRSRRLIEEIGVGIYMVAFILYICARLYLIVEMFIGLGAAPKSVYKTPDWTKFLPHTG